MVAWGPGQWDGFVISSGVANAYSTYGYDEGYTVVLKTDGSVKDTWGNPIEGTTYPYYVSNVSEKVHNIYSNNGTFVASKTDGTIVTFGHPDYGFEAPSEITTGGVLAIYASNYAFSSIKKPTSTTMLEVPSSHTDIDKYRIASNAKYNALPPSFRDLTITAQDLNVLQICVPLTAGTFKVLIPVAT